MSHNDTIKVDSKLFRLYAARRIRKGPHWGIEDVIEGDVETGYLNICTYVRNIALQLGHRGMINLGKLLFGFILGVFIVTPIMTFGLWLFTDNPFMPFFGKLGGIILVFEAFWLVFFVLDAGIHYLQEEGVFKQVSLMTTHNVVSEWFKAKRGKFCFNLKTDRPSHNKTVAEEDEQEWPRE